MDVLYNFALKKGRFFTDIGRHFALKKGVVRKCPAAQARTKIEGVPPPGESWHLIGQHNQICLDLPYFFLLDMQIGVIPLTRHAQQVRL